MIRLFFESTEECASCKSKILLGATLFLKYSNILTRFLQDCKPFRLLVRKLKLNGPLNCSFAMLMIVN